VQRKISQVAAVSARYFYQYSCHLFCIFVKFMKTMKQRAANIHGFIVSRLLPWQKERSAAVGKFIRLLIKMI